MRIEGYYIQRASELRGETVTIYSLKTTLTPKPTPASKLAPRRLWHFLRERLLYSGISDVWE